MRQCGFHANGAAHHDLEEDRPLLGWVGKVTTPFFFFTYEAQKLLTCIFPNLKLQGFKFAFFKTGVLGCDHPTRCNRRVARLEYGMDVANDIINTVTDQRNRCRHALHRIREVNGFSMDALREEDYQCVEELVADVDELVADAQVTSPLGWVKNMIRFPLYTYNVTSFMSRGVPYHGVVTRPTSHRASGGRISSGIGSLRLPLWDCRKSGQYTPHRPTHTFHNVLIAIVVFVVHIVSHSYSLTRRAREAYPMGWFRGRAPGVALALAARAF